jgi:hypothetical protein
MPILPPNRRQFLASTAPALLLAGVSSHADGKQNADPGETGPVQPTQAMPEAKIVFPTDSVLRVGGPKRLAAIVSAYWPFSHADDIVTRFIQGYSVIGRSYPPHAKVVSLYLDQTPEDDIGKGMAARYKIPVVKSVTEALTLGGKELAVDGVLLVASDGNYKVLPTGQLENPQDKLFEKMVEVFRAQAKSVPVFVDSALSWNWEKAKGMYNASKKERFPLMAGSSLPLTWHRPPEILRFGTKIAGAMMVCGGPPETNGFHALEALQSFVERRPGGETGVKAVRCLQGDAVWKTAVPPPGEHLWDRGLLDAALAFLPEKVSGDIADIDKEPGPTLFLIEYADKFKAACYVSPKAVKEFTIAVKLADGVEKPFIGTWFHLPVPQRDNFSFLCNNIEKMLLTDLPSYPVERTLLTTGMIAFLLQSRANAGARVPTPDLATISYRPVDA